MNRKIHYALLLTILILTDLLLFAQQGSISGVILQQDEKTSLPGANIYLKETKIGTMSNASGFFELTQVPAGKYVLVVSSLGYRTTQHAVNVDPNQNPSLTIPLMEEVSSIGEVMIAGEKGLREIAGSVQYISPRELKKFAQTDISRVLRDVPGVNVQDEDGWGLRPNIGLRGTGVERNSKITVMEDGVLIAPAPYAAPAAYYFPTMGRMHAIEIMKGSSQIPHGPYTTGGAINLISTPIPDELSAKVHLTAGNYGFRNLHAQIGNRHEQFAYLVETFRYQADGFKELDGGGNTGFDKTDYLVKFQWNTRKDAKVYQHLRFKLGNASEVSDETYLGLSEMDFEQNPFRRYAATQMDRMTTNQQLYALSHRVTFNDRFEINTTLYRTQFTRNWYKLNHATDSAGNKLSLGQLLSDAEAYGETLSGEGEPTNHLFVRANNRAYQTLGLQSVASYRSGNHDWQLGIRIHRDEMDRFQWDDAYRIANETMFLQEAGKPGTESNRIETASAQAAYVQYQFTYGKIKFTPGIRYERMQFHKQDFGKNDTERLGIDLKENTNQVNVLIPGAALHYQVTETWSTFLGVHQGFAPPGSKEGTLPETSINYELGGRYFNRAVSFQAVYFLNDYQNLLGSDLAAAGGEGTGDLFNGGEVLTHGIEFEAGFDLMSFFGNTYYSLPVRLSYTFTDARFQNTFDSEFEEWGSVQKGDAFPYLSQNQAAFSFGYELPKLQVYWNARFVDAMRSTPGQGEIPSADLIPAYWVMDATAAYQLNQYLSFTVSVNNLTNQTYLVAMRPAGLRPGLPRTAMIGIRMNLSAL